MRAPGRKKGSVIETAFHFLIWASALPKPPSIQEVAEFLNCHNSKARYWRFLYLRLLPHPPIGPGIHAENPDHPSPEDVSP